jgi:hypothetical protein
MAKPKPSDILFGGLACLSLALLLGFVLVLAGAISVESPGSAPETEEIASTQAEPVAEETVPAPAPEPATTATTAKSPALAAPLVTTVVITASRGDCWIEARLGSETGRLLYGQVLPQGDSVRLRGRRIWLSVGASGNVGVTVNGKPRELPSGTIEVVLDPTA